LGLWVENVVSKESGIMKGNLLLARYQTISVKPINLPL